MCLPDKDPCACVRACACLCVGLFSCVCVRVSACVSVCPCVLSSHQKPFRTLLGLRYLLTMHITTAAAASERGRWLSVVARLVKNCEKGGPFKDRAATY